MAHSPESIGSVLPNTGRDALGDKQVTCAAHGPYTSAGVLYTIGRMSREVWTPCAACEEARVAGERHEQAQVAAVKARDRMEAMISNVAIPARFVGRSLESFVAETPEQKKALAVSLDFAENFSQKAKRGDSLIFLGAPGTGKSHLATAILQAILPVHVGLYMTCSSLIRSVRNTWRKDSEKSEGEILNFLSTVPLLVIDEIGVQYGTDSEQNIIFEVLDRRYRDLMPTILLANLKLKREKAEDPAGLREVVGERVYDRLTEMARIVTLEGESFRRRARDAA